MNYEEIKRLIDDMREDKIDEHRSEFTDGIKIWIKKS